MLSASFDLENSLWKKGYKYICGVDEVGRGCFAGPVVVGAVIFPENCELIKGVADSKKLSAKVREKLAPEIKSKAVCWAVGIVEVSVINKIGIGKATQLAFSLALKNLKIPADFVLIDAFNISDFDPKKQEAIKNGDSICASIAAASIVAKVFRDNLMQGLEERYPGYGLGVNKGYGTLEHRKAIGKLGLCEEHRRSFDLKKFLI